MAKQLTDITQLFTDKIYVALIQKRLPKLFSIASVESSRAGKEGMQIGSLRENVIIALLLYAFGENRTNPEFAITSTETDVEIDGKPISIKTIKNNGYIKAIWTVDAESAISWANNYTPKMDMILAQICWGTKLGGLFLIPAQVQIDVFNKLGKEKYLKMPKLGTNPRGVEFSKEAITKILNDKRTLRVEIDWIKEELQMKNVYQRWVDYWKES